MIKRLLIAVALLSACSPMEQKASNRGSTLVLADSQLVECKKLYKLATDSHDSLQISLYRPYNGSSELSCYQLTDIDTLPLPH